MINKLLLIMMLLLVTVGAHAQSGGSPCPPGMIPGPNRCYGPNELPQQSNSSSAYTGPIWQDRYGAIASDAKTGSIGWASASRSKREARKAAIEDCGGGGCKIVMEGRNTCLAAAWGGGAAGYAGAIVLENAESSALETCKSTGGADCKITYSACSLPVRIR